MPHQDSKDELAALRKSFAEDFKPVGALEEMLVDQMAHAQWRLRRVLPAGASNINDLEKIARYESMLKRQMHQAMTQLKRLQQERRKESAKAPASTQAVLRNPKKKSSKPSMVPRHTVSFPPLKNLEEVTLIPWER